MNMPKQLPPIPRKPHKDCAPPAKAVPGLAIRVLIARHLRLSCPYPGLC